MRKYLVFLLGTVVNCLAFSTFAAELDYSGKADISANPFLAYGYNPKTKVISGYLAAFRVAPGRTDECKLVFAGSAERLSVKYLEETWVSTGRSESDNGISLTVERDEPYLKFNKETMGGDCDWILPFNVGRRVSETADEVVVKMRVPSVGDWIGVYVIGAKKARFHREPSNASVSKAYLIGGNVAYVYEEQPDWYFVRYDNGKKITTGWIRKSDTVQP
jgi:hypothetical protein